MIDKNTNEILQAFDSIRNAEIFLGIKDSRGKINQVSDGRRKTAYGYKWKFVE